MNNFITPEEFIEKLRRLIAEYVKNSDYDVECEFGGLIRNFEKKDYFSINLKFRRKK